MYRSNYKIDASPLSYNRTTFKFPITIKIPVSEEIKKSPKSAKEVTRSKICQAYDDSEMWY